MWHPLKSPELAPVWVEMGANNFHILRWSWHGNFSAVYHVYIDSVYHGTITSTSYTLPPAVPGRAVRVDVVAGAELDAQIDRGPSLQMPARGGRLRVTVPAASLDDNPDFSAYVIYWSKDGSDPTEELTRLYGANNNTFTTGILEDGVSYKFRAKLLDQHGNASDYGATSAAAVHNAPLAPESAAANYTQATRTAVVTASAPAGQAADVKGYALISNYLPGDGLQSALVDDVWLAWIPAGSTITFTTPELCAGQWRFAWVAVDGSGLRTRSAEVSLNLSKSGGNLVSITSKPSRPVLVDAYSGAGTIKAKVHIETYATAAITDLQSLTDTKEITSATRPFVAADAGCTLVITGGDGFIPGSYTIQSVASGVATLNDNAGSLPAEDGAATLILDQIEIYVDGVLDGTVAAQAETYDYDYESAAKAEANYAITATVLSGAVESEASDSIAVAVDATAPTGELGLTVEVVD